jgi:hypothetical protein
MAFQTLNVHVFGLTTASAALEALLFPLSSGLLARHCFACEEKRVCGETESERASEI